MSSFFFFTLSISSRTASISLALQFSLSWLSWLNSQSSLNLQEFFRKKYLHFFGCLLKHLSYLQSFSLHTSETCLKRHLSLNLQKPTMKYLQGLSEVNLASFIPSLALSTSNFKSEVFRLLFISEVCKIGEHVLSRAQLPLILRLRK